MKTPKHCVLILTLTFLANSWPTQAATPTLISCKELSKKFLILRGSTPNMFGYVFLSYAIDVLRLKSIHSTNDNLWAEKFDLEMKIAAAEEAEASARNEADKVSNTWELGELTSTWAQRKIELEDLYQKRAYLNGQPIAPNPHKKSKHLVTDSNAPIVGEFDPQLEFNPYKVALDLDKAANFFESPDTDNPFYEITYQGPTGSLIASTYTAETIYQMMQRAADSWDKTNTTTFRFDGNIILERPHHQLPKLNSGTPLRSLLLIESEDSTTFRFRLRIYY